MTTRPLPPPGRERDEAIAAALGWTGPRPVGGVIAWFDKSGHMRSLLPWSTQKPFSVELIKQAQNRRWEATQHLIYPVHSLNGWFEQYFDVGGYAYKHESASLADAVSGAWLLACWAEEWAKHG